MTCPKGITTTDCTLSRKDTELKFKFDKTNCDNCLLKDQCVNKRPLNGAYREVVISTRYDAVIRDMHNVSTAEYKIAPDKRYIVERRFTTMVRNHGLRCSRYLKIDGAKIHITMANIANGTKNWNSNIV